MINDDKLRSGRTWDIIIIVESKHDCLIVLVSFVSIKDHSCWTVNCGLTVLTIFPSKPMYLAYCTMGTNNLTLCVESWREYLALMGHKRGLGYCVGTCALR